MHGAAQKACEPGETMAQNSFTETNRFPFPTWTGGGLSIFLFFFLFVLIAFLFSSFFDLPHHEIGMGDREVAA
jgi:hypothetical protein